MHKWNPADYDKSSSAQYQWAMSLVEDLDLEGSERILDIGCGDGKITAHLASLVPHGSVLGLDLSQDMIEFARNKHPLKLHTNLSFEVGDASHLSFQEEFDQIVSFACLHWIRDQLPVLKGIRSSLKPGGRILLQCGGRGNATQILDLTGELISDRKWRAYFQDFAFPYNFYGPEEYRAWLNESGLVPIRVELVPKDMVHKGQSGLEGIIRNTWLPYTERIPPLRQQEFVSDVASRYLDLHHLDENGLVHVKMMRLEVVAEKPA